MILRLNVTAQEYSELKTASDQSFSDKTDYMPLALDAICGPLAKEVLRHALDVQVKIVPQVAERIEVL